MTDSIAIIVLCFGLMSFGAFYGIGTLALDGSVNEMNNQITDGVLSPDTFSSIDLCLKLWNTAPIIFILGLIIWMFARAKGDAVTATLFFEYETLLIVGLVFSVFLTWAYGLTADLIFNEIFQNKVLMNVSEAWDSSDMRYLLMKMYYLALLIPGLLASLLYMIHPILRQTDNTYSFFGTDDGSEENTGSPKEYVTPYEPAQFQ